MGAVLKRSVLAGWLLLAAASVVSCQRCSSEPGAPATPSAGSDSATAAPAPSAEAPELPEVKDAGPGRATAALRAAFAAYGIAFDPQVITRECKVDEDGASIDDMEDVADKYGLDARQIILPREHVLLPEASLLPGIVIVEVPGDEDALDFVLVWKVDGDRALVMDPVEGKRFVSRSELAKKIWVHEMSIAAEDWHAAETDARFQDALRARLGAIGVAADRARALVDRAAADPGSRGLGALDAAIRAIEGDAAKAAGDAGAFMTRALDCAIDKRCEGEPVAPAMWSARPAPKGADGVAEVTVKGAVMLTIAGKKAPSP